MIEQVFRQCISFLQDLSEISSGLVGPIGTTRARNCRPLEPRPQFVIRPNVISLYNLGEVIEGGSITLQCTVRLAAPEQCHKSPIRRRCFESQHSVRSRIAFLWSPLFP